MLPFQHPCRSQKRSLCPEEMLIPQAGSARGAWSREELRFGLLGSGNFPPVAVEPQDHGSSFCTSRAEGKERENLTLPRAAGIKPAWFWGIHWELQPLLPPGSCRRCWWQLSIVPSTGLTPRDKERGFDPKFSITTLVVLNLFLFPCLVCTAGLEKSEAAPVFSCSRSQLWKCCLDA